MKSFNEINEAKNDVKAMKKFVADSLENSKLDIEDIEKQFIKKFGKENTKHLHDALG